MAPLTIIFVTLCLSAVALLLYAEYRENRTLKWIAKPTASAAFIGVALSEGALGASAFGVLMLLGLLFCAAGDVLLIPRRERWFLAGMGAFALGHGAYVAAFLTKSPEMKLLVPVAAAVMGITAGVVLHRLWKSLGDMRGPVAAYIFIISVMVVASVAATPAVGGYFWPLIAGAIGFAVSDIAVARDQFIARALVNRLWGLPLYYAAQLVLASSV